MKIFDFCDNYKSEIVLCLGYFDSLHLGHKAVFDCALKISAEIDSVFDNVEVAVFTFSNDLGAQLKNKKNALFSFEERTERMSQLGVQCVICADADDKFLDTSGEDFLKSLSNRFNIRAIVAGSDYRFGKGGAGSVKTLDEFCSKHMIKLEVLPIECHNGEKIATSQIKRLISNGEIEQANLLLAIPYYVKGVVVEGRQDGRRIGFPTANVDFNNGKSILKAAVYYTVIYVDGMRFKAVSNVGAHPTFGDMTENIESFLLDFEGDLYGKTIKIEFIEKIREIEKFDNVEKLIIKIKQNVAYVSQKELV